MRRKKTRAKRQLVRSKADGALKAEMMDPEPSESVAEAAEDSNKGERDIDRQFDCFKEEFEEVETVVSAVMQMDTIIQQNQLKKSDGLENESNLEINDVNGFENGEKSDDLDVGLKCGEFEKTMEEEGVRGSNLHSNNEVIIVDSGNEIENGEEAKVHQKSEQKSVEGEPSAATVKESDGYIDKSYSNKKDEEEDGRKEQESRDYQEENEGIEVSDIKEMPQVFDHNSLTLQEKEKLLEIHVGGLHKDTVEQDLFEIFGKFGEVLTARIVRHPTTNKNKRFAFIQYATAEQAKKVLSKLKDGIKVRGKRVKLSISRKHDIGNMNLYLGNICKTWTKEDVLGKLKGYGIEDVDEIQVPIDAKKDGKIKGFSFLRFNTYSDAKAALHRLRKPDAVFGNASGGKVAFAHTPMHPRKEVHLQVKTVYVEGIPKCWDVQKLKEICEKYGETKKVKISRNFCHKGKDFGFISFTTRESAVACVGGMNKLQFGGNVKVKADIARPLVGGCLPKSSCRGLKLNKKHRNTCWRKMQGHARFEGAENKSDMKAHTSIFKSMIRGAEVKAVAVRHKVNQDPFNPKRTIEGETHDSGTGLSSKPKKTDKKRKNRKRRGDRAHMYSERPSRKPEGSSLGLPGSSSRNSKSRSHSRKGPTRGSYSIAHRVAYKEAYAASTSGYPGSAYGATSGSKRLSSDLEPHAGLVQPVKQNDQYYASCVTPDFRRQRQIYAGYLNLDTLYERQLPAKYFRPAIREDALPHAGLLEPGFRKQSLGVDDYPAGRSGVYNGPGNQGPVHRAGLASTLPYVAQHVSYARGRSYAQMSGSRDPIQNDANIFRI